MDFYAWVEKDLSRLKKLNSILGLIILLVIILLVAVGVFTAWSIQLEEYCRRKAQSIVGDKWNTLLEPNPGEYGYARPGKDKISLGFREQLKCERSTPLFHKLN